MLRSVLSIVRQTGRLTPMHRRFHWLKRPRNGCTSFLQGEHPYDMHEAAQLLEDISNGRPRHSPYLDVSWFGPHCLWTSGPLQ